MKLSLCEQPPEDRLPVARLSPELQEIFGAIIELTRRDLAPHMSEEVWREECISMIDEGLLSITTSDGEHYGIAVTPKGLLEIGDMLGSA